MPECAASGIVHLQDQRQSKAQRQTNGCCGDDAAPRAGAGSTFPGQPAPAPSTNRRWRDGTVPTGRWRGGGRDRLHGRLVLVPDQATLVPAVRYHAQLSELHGRWGPSTAEPAMNDPTNDLSPELVAYYRQVLVTHGSIHGASMCHICGVARCP